MDTNETTNNTRLLDRLISAQVLLFTFSRSGFAEPGLSEPSGLLSTSSRQEGGPASEQRGNSSPLAQNKRLKGVVKSSCYF